MHAGKVILWSVALAACGRLDVEGLARSDAAAGSGSPGGLPMTGRHWVNRGLSTPGPLISPRAVFDRARGTVILYGGDLAADFLPTLPSAAMWEYDGAQWSSLCDPCDPGPRVAPAMAYDTARDRIELYGGVDTMGVLGSQWEWNGPPGSNGSWTPVTPSGSPGPRGMAQMVYDERRHVTVLFGGGTSPGGFDSAVFEFRYVNSTPVWSPPTNAPTVLGGLGSTAAWNPTTQRIDVLEDHGTMDDTDQIWSYDGSTWRVVCAGCTGVPRRDASFVVDPSPSRSFEIGGYIGGQGVGVPGTWQLDATASSAQQLSTLPDKRDSAAVAYDARRDAFVLYGGNGTACAGNCAETWELVRD